LHTRLYSTRMYGIDSMRSPKRRKYRDSVSQLHSQCSAVVTGSQGYSRMHGCVSSSGMASSKRANSEAHLRVDISLLHPSDRDANLSVVSTLSHYQLNPITALPR